MPSDLHDEDLCEMWSPESPCASAHSTLVPLEPIGVGTPWVESLTSYVARLAEAHSLPTGALMHQVILPSIQSKSKVILEKRFPAHHLTRESSKVINNTGIWAQQWSDVVGLLTCQTSLLGLTLRPLANIVSDYGLVRQHRAWCPLCYDMWRGRNQPCYEPLIWHMALVKICAIHRINLQERCPFDDCRAVQFSLTKRFQSGYCRTCSRWLGSKASDGTVEGDNHEMAHVTSTSASSAYDENWHYWLAHEIGRVLALSSMLKPMHDGSHIFATLKEACPRIKSASGKPLSWRGMYRERGELIRVEIYQLRAGRRLSLESIAVLCGWLRVSPSSVLFDRDVVLDGQWPIPDLPQISEIPKRHNARRPFPVADAAAYLQMALQDDSKPPLSLTRVASLFGHPPSVFRLYFPEECAKISNRYKVWHVSVKLARQTRMVDEIRQVMMERHRLGKTLSLAGVSRDLAQPGIMRHPLAMTTWRTVREELNH